MVSDPAPKVSGSIRVWFVATMWVVRLFCYLDNTNWVSYACFCGHHETGQGLIKMQIPTVGVELARALPTVLWILFFIGLLVSLREPILKVLLPRLGSVEVMGFKFDFQATREELNQAIKKQGLTVSDDDLSLVLRRAQRLQEIVKGAQVLWVDDHPEYNPNIYRVLDKLGVEVDKVTNTEGALQMLEWNTGYDLVITDIGRGDDPDAGLKMLKQMRESNIKKFTVLFVRRLDESRGTPPYAFAITDRADQLIHYILDILERQRG
jgi:CheY-like chemotaxis protein